MESPVKVWRKSKSIYQNLQKEGVIVTFTQIYAAPSGFEHQIPYFVGIVKFKDGTKQTLEIVDSKEPQIGTKIKTVLRRINQASPEGVIHYGIKAKPIK